MTADQLADACRALYTSGVKPTLPEVRPLVDAYYKLPDNSAGGELHVVLDGCNYKTNFIRWTLTRAAKVETRALCHVLLMMSNSQRRRL